MLTLVAAYGIVVGVGVLGMWAASLATGGVPELATKPWEIRHHLAAEALLASTLIVGGILALAGVDGGRLLVVLGLGMALYSIINSSGYFVQRRQSAVVAMFATLLALTALAAGLILAGAA